MWNETDSADTVQQAAEHVSRLPDFLEEQLPSLMQFGMKVIFALVVFFIGRFLIQWVRRIVRRSLERSRADRGVAQFVDSLLKFVLYILLLFSIATNFGLDTATVAAAVASCGVALGLALQGSLANFAGGVLILVLKPFEVGDYIVEDTNKNEGTVKEIQIFYTKLSTVDNKTIVIPNGILTNNSLTNFTANEERQLDLKVDIAYGADLQKAKGLLEEMLLADESVLQDQEIRIFVDHLGESSVVLGARAWVKNEEYWPARWRLLEKIKPAAMGDFTYSYDGMRVTDIRWTDSKAGGISIYKPPEAGVPYVIGCDTAGDGSDSFVAQVLDNRTGEQVAVLRQTYDEDLFAKQVYCLGMHYNTALIGIETNYSTFPVMELERLRYPKQYVRESIDDYTHKVKKSYGFQTNSKTRPVIIAGLVEVVRESVELICHTTTLEEMLTFVRNEDGRAEAEAGAHDDCVMALAIAHYIRPQQRYLQEMPDEEKRKWTADMWEDYRRASPEVQAYLRKKWGEPG